MAEFEGLANVLERIRAAAFNAGRNPDDVKLIAVSKTFDHEAIKPVLDRGHRLFGENRVQEALRKWPALKQVYDSISLHLVGPLQTNKVKDVIGLFDAIHTVDRPKLARELAKTCQAHGGQPELMIQVNTGEEPQKAGVFPAEADAFIAQCRDEFGLTITGLMCIPPLHQEPALHFSLLRKIAQRNGLSGLSMGMSADFETAIAFGATHVRVGSAIFGERIG